MRVIVSGGGTGGHIYPALTLVDALRRREPDAEFLYVGTERGLEADLVPKSGLPFATVDVRGIQRKLTLANLAAVWDAARSLGAARRIVRDFRPHLAIGTGGYVCGPILLVAALMGVPTLVQEQNVAPGVTNRLLGRLATKVALGTPDAARFFPRGKTVFTGNPIRAEVVSATREEGFRRLNALLGRPLSPERKTLLVSGGSRGAKSINEAMLGVLARYVGDGRVQVVHVTGSVGYDDFRARLREQGVSVNEPGGNVSVVPYLYEMPSALAVADVAVFRAGAIGIAELTARGVPAVLVPYPFATANHQEKNARYVAEQGAARLVLDRELTAERLLSELDALLGDDDRLRAMSAASRALGRPHAADDIAQLALSIRRRDD